GDEPNILRASLDWKTVQPVLSAGQQARTVRPIPTAQGLFFATDTERERNHVYRLSGDGRLERLCETSGACLSSCQVRSAMFFSTDVEPSKVNLERSAALYGSADGSRWSRLLSWRKDGWHPWLFQYAHIVLPSGGNETNVLAATGSAVE